MRFRYGRLRSEQPPPPRFSWTEATSRTVHCVPCSPWAASPPPVEPEHWAGTRCQMWRRESSPRAWPLRHGGGLGSPLGHWTGGAGIFARFPFAPRPNRCVRRVRLSTEGSGPANPGSNAVAQETPSTSDLKVAA